MLSKLLNITSLFIIFISSAIADSKISTVEIAEKYYHLTNTDAHKFVSLSTDINSHINTATYSDSFLGAKDFLQDIFAHKNANISGENIALLNKDNILGYKDEHCLYVMTSINSHCPVTLDLSMAKNTTFVINSGLFNSVVQRANTFLTLTDGKLSNHTVLLLAGHRPMFLDSGANIPARNIDRYITHHNIITPANERQYFIKWILKQHPSLSMKHAKQIGAIIDEIFPLNTIASDLERLKKLFTVMLKIDQYYATKTTTGMWKNPKCIFSNKCTPRNVIFQNALDIQNLTFEKLASNKSSDTNELYAKIRQMLIAKTMPSELDMSQDILATSGIKFSIIAANAVPSDVYRSSYEDILKSFVEYLKLNQQTHNANNFIVIDLPPYSGFKVKKIRLAALQNGFDFSPKCVDVDIKDLVINQGLCRKVLYQNLLSQLEIDKLLHQSVK
jgi:hypothetical protein